MIYQLTYELRTSDKDYSDFFTFLEQGLGGEALHVLRDAWWLSVDEKWDIGRLCEEILTDDKKSSVEFQLSIDDSVVVLLEKSNYGIL